MHWLAVCTISTVVLAISGAVSAEDLVDSSEAVWEAVEARNATWTENDLEGHMALYHPNFRRWSLRSDRLMSRDDFKSLWYAIKANERVVSLKVIPKDVVFYANNSVAVAHYTVDEWYEWTGADTPTRKMGDKQQGQLRFSDLWVLEKGTWLYAGGHRDGMALPTPENVE